MNNVYDHAEYDSLQTSLKDRLKRIKTQYGVIHPKSNY
ncbi:hypothetical protein [Cyclobacterium sp.]